MNNNNISAINNPFNRIISQKVICTKPKISDEQFQSHYEMVQELVEQTDSRDDCYDKFIHINRLALHLAAIMKIHLENQNIYFAAMGNDKYKYMLPLLSLSEKEELRSLMTDNVSGQLADKIDHMSLVYDF